MIQVLSQLGVVYSIPFPELYANLLRLVGALELNFVDLLPLGCVLDISFYEALLKRPQPLEGTALLPYSSQCILDVLVEARARLTQHQGPSSWLSALPWMAEVAERSWRMSGRPDAKAGAECLGEAA